MIYLNNARAREILFTRGRIYVLRETGTIGKEKLTKGETDLYWDAPANRDKRVKFYYIGKMKNDSDLKQYQPISGYSSIEDWKKAAGRKKHLFVLKLVDFIKVLKW